MKRILTILMVFIPICIFSQELSKQEKKDLKQKKKEEKLREGKLMISPIAGPAYTPELGPIIAGGAIISWRTDKQDSTLPRSSFPVTVSAGIKGSIVLSAKLTSFWAHDKIRIYSDIWIKDMPDHYFGVGYDAGANTKKGDNTSYKRFWYQIYPQFYYRLAKNLYAGPAIDINYTKGRDAAEPITNDRFYSKYNNNPFNSGVGIHAMYDTRDMPVNAWKGTFVMLQSMFYRPWVGSDNNYNVYAFDARHYLPVTSKAGRIVAMELRGRFSNGNVPYGELSQLGTPFDLRGYLWGRYRDESMLFALVEYRHKFYRGEKLNNKASKSGIVIWTGLGSIANKADFNNLLPNFGLGYRFEMQPRMNLRVDFGFGSKGSMGFYFNFNEAF